MPKAAIQCCKLTTGRSSGTNFHQHHHGDTNIFLPVPGQKGHGAWSVGRGWRARSACRAETVESSHPTASFLFGPIAFKLNGCFLNLHWLDIPSQGSK